jgi:hypothetical protein
MSRRESLHLKIEMLRMRGAIERAEVAAAMADVRLSTRRIAAVASAVSTVGAALSGRAGWGRSLVGSLDARTMWAPIALIAVRTLRRYPVATLAVTAGALALAGWWVGHRRATPGPDAG